MDKPEGERYLLLAIKSLSQNRQFKKYQLTINSLDNSHRCQIENIFQHSYEYVYKLWPCPTTPREFVKIHLLEVVDATGREILVKRGEASPLVVFSEEGEKFQFAGSRDEKCVLILRFKVNTLETLEKELSSRQLEDLNEEIETQLAKNKHERKAYRSYLDYTNRFLDRLDNGRYTNAESNSREVEDLNDIKQAYQLYNEQIIDSGKFYEMRSLSNDKYFSQSVPIEPNKMQESIQISSSNDFKQHVKPTNLKSIPPKKRSLSYITADIKKRRELYSRKESPPEFDPSPTSIEATSKEQFSDKLAKIEQEVIETPKQSQKSVIIRTNDFPLKQIKAEAEPVQKNERRKKFSSENKEIKQSYGKAIQKIEDVDLGKIFDSSQREEPIQGKLMKVELCQLKINLYKGNFELPKKLIMFHEKAKYQTPSEQMKNKSVEWKGRIIIPKASTSSTIVCKIISMHEFGPVLEGESRLLINDLIGQSQEIKVYLYSSNIAIGCLQFEIQFSPYFEELPTLRVEKQRKTVSLPQISQQIKKRSQGQEKQFNQSSLRLNRKGERMLTQNCSISIKKGESAFSKKIKERKLKIRAKFK